MAADQIALRERTKQEVLKRGYGLLAQTTARVNAYDVCDDMGIAPQDFFAHVFEEMKELGLIDVEDLRISGSSRSFPIPLSAAALLAAEEMGLPTPADVAAHEEARLAVLRYLAQVRSEHGPAGIPRLGTLVSAGVEPWRLDWAVRVLEHLGYIDRRTSLQGPAITPLGLQMLGSVERQGAISAQLAAIEPLEPQARGKALEALVVDALQHQGCSCVKDTGGTGEQIDLAIESGMSFFLAECKWLKDPVEGGVVSEMVGRLMSRPASVMGVVFSMNGFTQGAYAKVAALANQRVVLLIPGPDLRGIIVGERKFNGIVSEQLRQIVAQGKLQNPKPGAKAHTPSKRGKSTRQGS
jgi:hypothetical protein